MATTPLAPRETLEGLRATLARACAPLADVTERRMFGCDGFFTNAQVFGLVWKTGRLGLRLPEPALFGELMGTPGAAPWTAGAKAMSHWVLVPESFHADPRTLGAWVARAHRLAGAAAQAPSKKAPANRAATPSAKAAASGKAAPSKASASAKAAPSKAGASAKAAPSKAGAPAKAGKAPKASKAPPKNDPAEASKARAGKGGAASKATSKGKQSR